MGLLCSFDGLSFNPFEISENFLVASKSEAKKLRVKFNFLRLIMLKFGF